MLASGTLICCCVKLEKDLIAATCEAKRQSTPRASNGAVKHAIEILADILCKKPQNEIAVLLQQPVFSAITAVGFRIGKML